MGDARITGQHRPSATVAHSCTVPLKTQRCAATSACSTVVRKEVQRSVSEPLLERVWLVDDAVEKLGPDELRSVIMEELCATMSDELCSCVMEELCVITPLLLSPPPVEDDEATSPELAVTSPDELATTMALEDCVISEVALEATMITLEDCTSTPLLLGSVVLVAVDVLEAL